MQKICRQQGPHRPLLLPGQLFQRLPALPGRTDGTPAAAGIQRRALGDQPAQAALEGRPIPPLPPLAERWDTAVRQIELAVADKGEHIALLEARKQLCWYLKGVSHANYYKEQIVRLTTLEELYRVAAGVRRDLR